MSASESAPATSDLHKSIEQLIAEAERQARAAVDTEKDHLHSAMRTALDEIESSQQAMARAASALRAALGDNSSVSSPEPVEIPAPSIKEEPIQPTEITTDIVPVADRGEHELDVIAHHASIGNASSLQAMLRARSEVKSAQTREFVNGELRLQLSLRNELDMAAFTTWLGEHNGTLVTTTGSVIEVRFAS